MYLARGAAGVVHDQEPLHDFQQVFPAPEGGAELSLLGSYLLPVLVPSPSAAAP